MITEEKLFAFRDRLREKIRNCEDESIKEYMMDLLTEFDKHFGFKLFSEYFKNDNKKSD